MNALHTENESGSARPFSPINRGYDSTFCAGELTVGLVVPIESYPRGPVPTMADHLERVQLAEKLGFAAVWLRDVPFNVPSFGDAGQLLDPFVYLGLLAGGTKRIALGVASIVLPLRHPAHVAKAAASADALSGGRLIMGIASGDRPEEYPALNQTFADRGDRFRASFEYIRQMSQTGPSFQSRYGQLGGGMDMLPKPTGSRLPMLITGGSQQDPEWIARHGDGWMIYPRAPRIQAQVIDGWRGRIEAAGQANRPAMQPLYVDLAEDDDAPATPIHLGLRLGANTLSAHLEALRAAGINHVALNLRFNQADVPDTLERLAAKVLPSFHQHLGQ